MHTRRQPLVALLAALLPVLLLAGIWIGGHPSLLPGPLRAVFVDRQTRTVDDALDIIQQDYYRPVSRARLIDHGLAGAVRQLDDRFSNYLSPGEYGLFQQSSQGRFSGVGMEVTQTSRGLRVTRVFTGSPAAKARIRRSDEIVAVNGRSLAGRSSSLSTALIRGRAGTRVTLTVTSPSVMRAAALGKRICPSRVETLPKMLGSCGVPLTSSEPTKAARSVGETKRTFCPITTRMSITGPLGKTPA
jgi:carboxyl-terminal processing protease